MPQAGRRGGCPFPNETHPDHRTAQTLHHARDARLRGKEDNQSRSVQAPALRGRGDLHCCGICGQEQ